MKLTSPIAIPSAGIALLLAAPPASGQCPEWTSGFGLDGVNDYVASLHSWNGELYVGGDFWESGGGEPMLRVARWDGSRFEALGAGVNDRVSTMIDFDDGTGSALYVAGRGIDQAGGVPVSAIARWDGTSWSDVGGGVGGVSVGSATTDDFAVFDDGTGPALYIGGSLTWAGVVPVNNIARWDGTSWSDVQGGCAGGSGDVNALAVFDDGTGPALYAGGHFTVAGGYGVSNIARWDGTTWSDVDGGVGVSSGTCVSSTCRVSAMEVFDDGSGPALYVAGRFTRAGGLSVQNIARWDGTSWSALPGGGLNSNPTDLVVYDDGFGSALFASGGFSSAGGAPAVGLARYNGAVWEEVGSGLGSGGFNTAAALGVYDDGNGAKLFAGGNVSTLGTGLQVNNIVSWDGADWAQLGMGQGMDEVVHALGVFDDGFGAKLYAGGEFEAAGPVAAEHVARWNGTEWETFGGAFGVGVFAFETFDDGTGDALYVGGQFGNTGGVTALYVSRYDGTSWSAVGGGLPQRVEALAAHDDGSGAALYAGGVFNSAGLSRIARWDGTTWADVGGGMDGEVLALEVWNGDLYAGGDFTTAGGVPALSIARWDGASWSPLGPGLTATVGSPEVAALAVYDDGTGPALFAAGHFRTAGALSVDRIARWDGGAWSALGVGLSARAYALAVFDDGAGESLYVGGQFALAGGSPSDHLARWDGASWSPPTGGTLDADVRALAVFDDGSAAGPSLFAGGEFRRAGPRGSYRIARASCPSTGIAYCTPGTTASGCQALLSTTGSASLSSPSGFVVSATGGEGQKDGLFYFGTNGPQAGAWGNGTSFQCVVPPVRRTGIQSGVGSLGACDNLYQLDFNSWMAAHPAKAPPAGDVAYLQCWFRDPANTSNQGTSLSDALSFAVGP